MKKIGKIVMIVIASLSIVFMPKITSAKSLPAGFLIGDETGFTAKKDGKYFIEMNDIKPGIQFSKDIKISNYTKDKQPLAIQLVLGPDEVTKRPEVKGKINLMKEISVKLTIGNRVLYQGLMDGTGKNNKRTSTLPIKVGTFKAGDSKTIQAVFTVADGQPEELWETVSSADFYWVFYATHEPTKKEQIILPKTGFFAKLPPKIRALLPQTGEDLKLVIVGIIVGLLLILIVLMFYRNKRQKEKEIN